MSQRVGESLYDIERASESGAAQTGLAYSGTVETQASNLKRRQTKGYQLGFESLAQQLKEAHGLLDIQREQDVANIDLTVAGLEGERKMLEAQRESKFLGIF